MAGLLAWLGRYARPLLLAAGVLLTAGLLLTLLHLLVLGWSVYIVGHVLAIAGFVAYAAIRRETDGWAWAGLLVLVVGLVLALPQLYGIWIDYVQAGSSAAMQMPVETAPFGLAAELITWIGLAFYALAAYGARALSGAAALAFVEASMIGVAAALNWISPLAWSAAMLLVGLGLLWLGSSTPAHAAEADAAENEPENAPELVVQT